MPRRRRCSARWDASTTGWLRASRASTASWRGRARQRALGGAVVVLPGTGGAALDIALWMEQDGEISSTDVPDPEYEAIAKATIPQI